jgi:hypothetical protein
VDFGIPCSDEVAIEQIIDRVGTEPVKVVRVKSAKGDYLTNELLVIFPEKHDVERMLAFNGRQLRRGPMSVLPAPYSLSMEQIFETCMCRLRVRDNARDMEGEGSDPNSNVSRASARAVRRAAARDNPDIQSNQSDRSDVQEAPAPKAVPERQTPVARARPVAAPTSSVPAPRRDDNSAVDPATMCFACGNLGHNYWTCSAPDAMARGQQTADKKGGKGFRKGGGFKGSGRGSGIAADPSQVQPPVQNVAGNQSQNQASSSNQAVAPGFAGRGKSFGEKGFQGKAGKGRGGFPQRQTFSGDGPTLYGGSASASFGQHA